MTDNHHRVQYGQSLFERLAYLIAACIFIILGLIGLVIPVIPGVIFLVVAAMLLAKVSKRMDRWVKQNQFARRTQARVAAVAHLSWSDKVKITLWYTAATIIHSLTAIGRQLNKLKP